MSKRPTYTTEEIERMIIDYLQDELSPADTLALKDILARDPDAQAIWGNYVRIKRLIRGKALAEDLNTEAAWSALEDQLTQDKVHTLNKRSTLLWLAASLVFIAGISLFLYFQRAPGTTQSASKIQDEQIQLHLDNGETYVLAGQQTIHSQNLEFKNGQFTSRTSASLDTSKATIRVPVGKVFNFMLDDGTQVFLNSGSTLRFPVAFASDRKVSLDGEAYFEVAHDARRRFIVRTKSMDIQVLGTKFNVRSYAQLPAVTSLLEGSIQVSGPALDQAVKIAPGYEVVQRGENLYTQKIENPHMIAWIEGMTYFYNRPLSEIVELINVSTPYHLRIANKQIGTLRFSGAFKRQDDVDSILRLFTQTSSVRYRQEADDTILY